ncbi:MAG: IclR family transcriptional regulator [Thermomicrobiales bacterium]|nr:IclR family transcriptional regulator [Thermomicrobiales bacterium]
MPTERDPQEVTAVLSAGKALAIVEVMLQAPGSLSAREIGERSGVNRTTAHRLLNTLMLHGWVERHDEGGYRLSVRFLALAHVSSQVRGLFGEIRPALEPLSELSRETVHVGVLDGFDVVHVDKIESLEHVGVSSRIGARGVTHRTGLGKALLAASPDSFIEAYIAQGATREERYAVGPDEIASIWADVALCRQRGFSLDDEDDSVGVRCLGAAVCGAGGHPLFSISLTGPSPRFTREACLVLAPTLLQTVADLSVRFGGLPHPAWAGAAESAA